MIVIPGNADEACWQGGHVFGALDLGALSVVDGGEVFEQLEGSQCVRCHSHIGEGTETVSRECLGKHADARHVERKLQSNP